MQGSSTGFPHSKLCPTIDIISIPHFQGHLLSIHGRSVGSGPSFVGSRSMLISADIVVDELNYALPPDTAYSRILTVASGEMVLSRAKRAFSVICPLR